MTSTLSPETGYAAVQGGELFYERSGNGPVVVLIHAGICDLRMWDAQMPVLAENYTVVRYDCRGFGRTRTNPVAFSNRQDLASLLDHLEIPQAVIVGCSRGGMIALDFALEFPDRAVALGWVCSGVGGYQTPDEAFDPEELALFEAMEAAEEAHDHERVADFDVRLWVDGPLQPEGRAAAHVRETVRAMALNNYTSHAHLFEVGLASQPLAPPAAERLHNLHIPIFAVLGELDSVSTAAAAEYLVQHVPAVQLVRYPDAAHLPNMEHPERFNRDLHAFLDHLPRW